MIFQEITWIRSNISKFCPSLRKQVLEWYRPFRFVPCFLQKYFKSIRQRFRKIPIIVQMQPTREISISIHATAQASGCKVNSSLYMINAFSAKVNAKTLEKLIKDTTVKKIWYDRPVKAVLDVAAPAVKAPNTWSTNISGKGIGVAVIDTGIHPHADLNGRIKAFKDLVQNKTAPYDDNGHGTHVAGDIAGSGALYKGTAPAASIIGVKVLNKQGSGMLSTVIQGIQWCIENKDEHGIKVINMSLGSTAVESYKNDPVCQAVEAAWTQNIVVCVAAGNEGPESRTISSPGIDPYVITVGAVDDKNSLNFNDYEIAGFSSRGPSIDGYIKPDVVCPGTNVISLRSPNSTIDKQNKAARVGSQYISLSGTSMATPICAGVAALMLEADSSLTPDKVKEILKNTSKPLHNIYEDNMQGKGLVDAKAAIEYIQ